MGALIVVSVLMRGVPEFQPPSDDGDEEPEEDEELAERFKAQIEAIFEGKIQDLRKAGKPWR